MTGMIFNIQKFCTNDGPGIRTTVFFKGCPLRCLWCHNPESQAHTGELLSYPDKCKGCGRCRDVAPSDPTFVCYNDAREWCGKSVSVDEVLDEVLKDKIFYEHSGGGMTLSGGEPLAQFDFALALLQGAKQSGLHTAVETCGYTSEEHMRRIAPYVDLFLFDYKESDPERHRQYTGVGNERILQNLVLLDELGKDVILRCPIIPGCNDRPDHYDAIRHLVGTLHHVRGIDIEPYHSLGEDKYAALGKDVQHFRVLSDGEVAAIIKAIQNGTSVPVKKA